MNHHSLVSNIYRQTGMMTWSATLLCSTSTLLSPAHNVALLVNQELGEVPPAAETPPEAEVMPAGVAQHASHPASQSQYAVCDLLIMALMPPW
jgi:hypothetical protein